MRAALFYADQSISVQDVPEPKINADEALLRVEACGVCGTDLRIQSGDFLAECYPVLPGHEIAARVEAVGDEVSNVRPGDLVAVNPNMACGQCYACLRGKPHLCPEMRAIGVQLPGGFAEKL
ncbi:MAG: alcohol dehydrogenase catalytic domain-containing protein, partial [Armatimonadota bacterium]